MRHLNVATYQLEWFYSMAHMSHLSYLDSYSMRLAESVLIMDELERCPYAPPWMRYVPILATKQFTYNDLKKQHNEIQSRRTCLLRLEYDRLQKFDSCATSSSHFICSEADPPHIPTRSSFCPTAKYSQIRSHVISRS